MMKPFNQQIVTELTNNQPLVLVSIIDGSGSSPRGAGAKMGVTSGGCFGTIGGGAVEFESQKMAKQLLQEKRSCIHFFDLSPNQIADLGMICGGNVTVLFQYIAPTEAACRLFEKIAQLSLTNTSAWSITQIEEDGTWRMAAADCRYQFVEGELSQQAEDFKHLMKSKCILEKQGRTYFYAQPLVRVGRVMIFGGGHITKQLVPVLDQVFFPCTVIDSHPDFTKREVFPRAREVLQLEFADAFQHIAVTENDYIIIVTRGHQYDYEVLCNALRTPARYIGMIGSKKKIHATYDRLIKHDGFGSADVTRIHAPIGLDIGGRTPEEIAISIAAQLIQVRTSYDGR